MPQRQKTAPIQASELPDLTAQQMEFVRHLLAGKTGADAYRLAYNTDNMLPATVIAAASRLRADTNVSAWLSAARQAHLGTAVLTRDSHMAELERLREIAIASGNVGAAVQAEQLRGKVAGHQIERTQELPATDPVELLKDIAASSSPEAQAFALSLAAEHGIDMSDLKATRH